MRTKKLKVPLWGYYVIVYDTDNFAPILDKLEEEYTGSEVAWTIDYEIKHRGFVRPTVHILLNSKVGGDKSLTPGVIAHEALHATLNILNGCGVVVGVDNDEAIAYTLDWLVTEIHKFIYEL